MSRLLPLLAWLAFPIYVWQGIGVRLRTERMRPAEGPVLHRIDGQEPAISLLVLGDSSAASVGIGHTENGLAAQLALLISDAHRPRRLLARRRLHLGDLRPRSATMSCPTSRPSRGRISCLSIGTNDTKNFHSVPRFKKAFGGLLYALRAKWPEARVVWSPVVDFTRVPALPPLLGRILEIRAGAINAMGERLCHERGAVPATRLPMLDPIGLLRRRLSRLGSRLQGLGRASASERCWARVTLPSCLPDVPVRPLPPVTGQHRHRDRRQRHHRELPEIAPLPAAPAGRAA